MNKLIPIAIALALAGCESERDEVPADAEATRAPSATTESAAAESKASESMGEAEKAAQIYADYFEMNLQRNPVYATFLGDHRFNDRMPNTLAAEFRAESMELEKQYLKRLEQLDKSELSGQDLLSYQVFKLNREDSIEGDAYPGHLIPINQFYNMANFFAMLGSGKSAQPFKTEQDYRNFISRSQGFTVLVDQAIENMREGMRKGVVQPKVLMAKVIPQLEAHVVEDVTTSLFYQPVANMPDAISGDARDSLTKEYTQTITDVIIPAYKKLRDFIATEYLPAARESSGMVALPNGKDWYNYLVRSTTSTELTADDIHQIGLDEVARIHGEMEKVMEQVDFDGNLQEFFEFTKTDPQFIPESKEALLQAYENLRGKINAATPNLFKVIPSAEYEIRAVEPFREQSSSAASYQSAAPDGSRSGIFYVNTYDLTARQIWTVESLFLHEAAPGHHFQLSTQQELKDLPKFRRFGGNTAYVEGWGLYSESLGKELGFYEDPYQYYGALSAELWRAIRLVVDTGLHAKGWSREKVLEYMYANAPVAEARAVSEAERFMAIPSQALAYKIGQMKIRELRNLAEEELGEAFDVREFHYQVLKDGALPLNILENKIKRWIAEQQS